MGSPMTDPCSLQSFKVQVGICLLSDQFPREMNSCASANKQSNLQGWPSGSPSIFGPRMTSQGLCQWRYFMKPAQASHTPSECVSTDVRTSSRCSTFTSSEVTHCVSLKPSLSGLASVTNWLKQHSLMAQRSGGDSGFWGQRWSQSGASMVAKPLLW